MLNTNPLYPLKKKTIPAASTDLPKLPEWSSGCVALGIEGGILRAKIWAYKIIVTRRVKYFVFDVQVECQYSVFIIQICDYYEFGDIIGTFLDIKC